MRKRPQFFIDLDRELRGEKVEDDPAEDIKSLRIAQQAAPMPIYGILRPVDLYTNAVPPTMLFPERNPKK